MEVGQQVHRGRKGQTADFAHELCKVDEVWAPSEAALSQMWHATRDVAHILTWRNAKFMQEESACRRLFSSRFSPLLFSHGPREKRRFGAFWNSKAAGKHSKAHFTARWDLFLTIYVYLIRLFCFLSVSWIYVLFFTVYLTLCARAQGLLI